METSLRKHAWSRVFLLSLAAFIFNTTEFIPVGLLADLGRSFQMTPAEIGPILTIYAWVVTLASLPAMLIFAHVERKRLLICVFVLFVLSHFACALSDTYLMLALSRIGIALSHSIFWSITGAMVIRLAPEGKGSQALGLLSTGTVLAMVLGVPLGRVLGHILGWRVIFAMIGLLALLLMLLLIKGLPRMAVMNNGSFKSLPELKRNKPLLWLYLLTALAVTGQFTVYTYLEPLVEQGLGYSTSVTTWLLLIFGGAGLVGSFLFGKINPTHPRGLLISAVLFLSFCLFMVNLWQQSYFELIFLCALWGAGMMVLGLTMQSWVLALGANATDIVSSIYSGIFNLGIGAGALIGSQVAHFWGVAYNHYFGALFVCLALFPLTRILKLTKQSEYQIKHYQ